MSCFFEIGDGWRIAADNQQWIIQQRRLNGARVYWQSMRYIGSTTDVLLRVIDELGIAISDAQRAQIEGWPLRFRDPRNPVSSGKPIAREQETS